MHKSLEIRDGCDFNGPGKSTGLGLRASCTQPSYSLLPSREVERQGIQTPLQYKAAVMAAQGSSCALRRPRKQERSRPALGDHLSGTRFAQGRSGSKKSGSGARQSLSRRGEHLPDESKTRKMANPASMQKKLVELQKRRLPAYGSIRSSKIVRCANV